MWDELTTVVGLTGGIASGKSTVSTLLAKHNIPIIDADVLARVVVEPGTSGFRAVVAHFGADRVLTPKGELDRAALGDIVFHDAHERRWLNGVIHPRVRREIVKRVIKAWLSGEWVVVLDVPLLIEAGLWRWVGEVVVVFVNDKLQLSRLLARPLPDPSAPPLTQQQARARIASQMPLSEKASFATSILDNSGTLVDLSTQVDRLVAKWKKQQGGESGWWWRVCLIPPIGATAGLLCLLSRWWHTRKGVRRRARGEVERLGPRGEQIELREMRRRATSSSIASDG